MASKVPIIVYDYVRRALVKSSEGIASLPNKQAIMSSMQDIFNRLKSGGYNAITAEKVIKNQDDLRKVLNTIDADEIADIKKRKEDSERLSRVIDKMDRNIPLNPSDQYDQSEGVLDAFRGFEPKVIQGGKSEGIEQLLKSGDVKRGLAPKTTKETIERKSMIDPKLTEEENIKNMMAENKAAAKRLEQKMNPEKDLGDRLKDYDGDPDAMAQGGIAMLAEGGPENKGRRTFLKAAAGLASIPILGKFFKPAAKVAETAGPAVAEGVKLGFSKFMMLVDKIKRLGRKTDAVTQKEREVGYVYQGKNGDTYELVEDISTGDVRITKDKVGIGSYDDKTFDTIEDRSTFVLKRNQADETTKGKKPPDEYDEMKEVPGPDGTFDDIDEVSDTAVEEVLEELGETKIKKAGGGLAHMLGE